jgi:hypothetical protein
MNFDNSNITLVVECQSDHVMEEAYAKAKVSFDDVSPISKSMNSTSSSFIVASGHDSLKIEKVQFLSDRQNYINWCLDKNTQLKRDVLNAKLMRF